MYILVVLKHFYKPITFSSGYNNEQAATCDKPVHKNSFWDVHSVSKDYNLIIIQSEFRILSAIVFSSSIQP